MYYVLNVTTQTASLITWCHYRTKWYFCTNERRKCLTYFPNAAEAIALLRSNLCQSFQVTLRLRSGPNGVCVLSHVDKGGKWGHDRVFLPPMGRCAAVPCGKHACATTPRPVQGNTASQAQVCSLNSSVGCLSAVLSAFLFLHQEWWWSRYTFLCLIDEQAEAGYALSLTFSKIYD